MRARKVNEVVGMPQSELIKLPAIRQGLFHQLYWLVFASSLAKKGACRRFSPRFSRFSPRRFSPFFGSPLLAGPKHIAKFLAEMCYSRREDKSKGRGGRALNFRLLCVLCFLSISVAATAVAQERVLHFPPDRSLGELKLLGEPDTKPICLGGGFHKGFTFPVSDLGEAKGGVQVPADARVALFVSGTECPDLSPLADLKPGEIESLSIAIKQVKGNVPRPPTSKGQGGDACLAMISKMEGLSRLSLYNIGATATGWAKLADLTSLQHLWINDYLDAAAAAQLGQVKSLRSLYVKDLTPLSVEVIKKMEASGRPFLRDATPISSEILCALAPFPSLEELHVRRIQPDAFACLNRFASLRTLSLGMGGGAEGMPQLNDMPALTSLEIDDLTDEELASFPDMPKLKTLQIIGKGYTWTAAGFANLSRFTGLENLAISAHYDDEAFTAMPIIPSLKSLGLLCPIINYTGPLTDAALEHIAKFRSLESLATLVGHFTDDGFEHLAGLPNLKWLYTPNSRVTDAGLAHLGKCTKLEYLVVGVTEVTDAGIAQLEGLSQLKELEFCWKSHPRITEEAVARLQEKIPGLTVNKWPPP